MTENDVTQHEWEKLPWLLSRKEVLRVTGLTVHDLRKLVDADLIHRHVPGVPGGKGKYFKSELVKLCRVK